MGRKKKDRRIKVKKGFDIAQGESKSAILVKDSDGRIIKKCGDINEAERFIDFIKRN